MPARAIRDAENPRPRRSRSAVRGTPGHGEGCCLSAPICDSLPHATIPFRLGLEGLRINVARTSGGTEWGTKLVAGYEQKLEQLRARR